MSLSSFQGCISVFQTAVIANLEATLCITTIIAIVALSFILCTFKKYCDDDKCSQVTRILYRAVMENDVMAVYNVVKKWPRLINFLHPIEGYTPFMCACLNGNTQLVKLMLASGADVALKSSKGESAFYLAIYHHVLHPRLKDASCIHALFYAGANINDSNLKGCTPLHFAAMFGHTHLVTWLLNKGAEAILDPDPYMLARGQGHYETAMVLKRRMLPAIQESGNHHF